MFLTLPPDMLQRHELSGGSASVIPDLPVAQRDLVDRGSPMPAVPARQERNCACRCRRCNGSGRAERAVILATLCESIGARQTVTKKRPAESVRQTYGMALRVAARTGAGSAGQGAVAGGCGAAGPPGP